MVNKFKRFTRDHFDWYIPLVIWILGALFLIVLMRWFENRSIFEALYYCVVTASTTGFGDIAPITIIGRIGTMIYMLTAITAMGIFINALLARSKSLNRKKRLGMVQIKKSPKLVIIGYPSKSKVLGIVESVRAYWEDCEIVCICEAEEKPSWMYDYNVHFVRGRGSQIEILERANILNAENILILAENPADLISDEQTFSVVTLCEQMNQAAHTVAEKVHSGMSLLNHSLCDKVVAVCRPNELASEIIDAGIIDFIDSIVSPLTNERQKNVSSGNTTKLWQDLVVEFLLDNDIALGFSVDKGKSFVFAPPANENIPANSIIKVLTRK